MVVYYQIAGKKVGSHFLAMGVLGTMFGGVFLATRGGGEKKQATPPIQAASKDEETFIHGRRRQKINRLLPSRGTNRGRTAPQSSH
ncbi:hypothetical protein P168DRAFT_289080 [Aspergillus campestris IBT 28561]|uniref:Uncharacterized protein n=1 Tax=Aspergillus campestris (strain IBT 28561) TaxID=1392248 RepID=A0A2I1D6X5_ASPC2|nr:uncharacterized protein P168DRAFT_289080 [Aspergillus campestris IBT 28561]PKY05624.1 hypothetical protein P168DRAFT_289080 [Aspergillus campestris IBT 28561]